MYNYNYLNDYNFGNNINTNSYVPSYDHLGNDRGFTSNVNDEREMVGSMRLFSPTEAYVNGNLFQDLYKPYKNYKPAKLRATNERQRLYLELSQISFAAHELNLYLDLHPEDKIALRLFNDYRVKANELLNKYEKEYGPLTISSDALNTSPFLWEEKDFPFDKGGVSNV